jgi:hypothetical protein
VIVALYFWKIRAGAIPLAIAHMAFDRTRLKKLQRTKFISFYKLLGTGKGESFTPRDADPLRWGLLVCMDKDNLAEFDNSKLINSWRRFATSESRFELLPISSRGLWSGIEPFEITAMPDWNGSIAALTRARIVTKKNLQFWRAVPPVTTTLHASPGLHLAIGIGEAPIGLQGTFSVWNRSADLLNFAYKGIEHQKVIAATQANQWYSEELFARFAVISQRGELDQPR